VYSFRTLFSLQGSNNFPNFGQQYNIVPVSALFLWISRFSSSLTVQFLTISSNNDIKLLRSFLYIFINFTIP
jgi:hypothetical protein